MRASLPWEIAEFLGEHGPATGKQISARVRARLTDVYAVLHAGGFSRVPRPEGAEPGRGRPAEYWIASQRVRHAASGKSRADVLLDVLADGEAHTRDEIFAQAGLFFHTNNAAKELRDRNLDVRYDRRSNTYQLFTLAEPEATSSTSTPLNPVAPADSLARASGSASVMSGRAA